MNTPRSELERWLRAPREDEHLEFKEAKNGYDTTKLFRYCVALANEGGTGAKMVLGVSDKPPRRVVSSAAFPNTAAIASPALLFPTQRPSPRRFSRSCAFAWTWKKSLIPMVASWCSTSRPDHEAPLTTSRALT